MYNSKKIIIDTRKLDMYDIFERYKSGLLIFYEKRRIVKSQKISVIKEVLEALARGIPFPPVYVSELQTGKLLVLDKSDRLRFLMEYLEHAFGITTDRDLKREFGDPYFMKDVLYTEVLLYVIDYWNPKYMHMQVGAFIEEWTVAQEQSVRNILYDGAGVQALEKVLTESYVSRKSEFQMQYGFIYFIMVHFILIRKFDGSEYENADKFQLIDQSFGELEYIKLPYLIELRDAFMRAQNLFDRRFQKIFNFRYTQERKTKYVCFIGAWMQIYGEYCLDELLESKEMKRRMTECDMSYRDIHFILEDFRRKML